MQLIQIKNPLVGISKECRIVGRHKLKNSKNFFAEDKRTPTFLLYLSAFFFFFQVFSRIVFILLPALPFSLFSQHNFQMNTLEYNRVAFTYYLSIPVRTENVGQESSKFSTIIQSEFLFHVADFASSPSFLQKDATSVPLQTALTIELQVALLTE